MFYSLSVLRRLAAAFLVFACLFSFAGVAGSSFAESLPLGNERTDAHPVALTPVTLTGDEKLIAHHEGSSAGVGQLLHDEQAVEVEVTDSLWGNLLLSMAYRRDAELQKLVKRMGVSNNLFLASIAGVSGLGLAQSITGLATLNNHQASGSQHSHGGHGHDHSSGATSHQESLAPSIMGVIGSGATLMTIGAHVYFEHRYKKKIKTRQQAINHEILQILNALEGGTNFELVQPKLTSLVGERASREFLQLWRVTHP